MKTFIGFVIGGLFSTLVILMGPFSPLKADADSLDSGLSGMVPDIENMYREALVSPIRDAEAKIYDADIASYYDRLVDRMKLDEPATATRHPSPQ